MIFPEPQEFCESTDQSFFPPLELPLYSRNALLSPFVIEIGLEYAENVAVAILKRLCWKDREASYVMCRMVTNPLSNSFLDTDPKDYFVITGRIYLILADLSKEDLID